MIDAYDAPRDGHEGGQVETVGMSELGTVCALFLCSFNAGILLYGTNTYLRLYLGIGMKDLTRNC